MRKIGLKYRSLSGIFFSAKNNKEVHFESSLERDFIYMLEMDPNVISFLEQPLIIRYKDSNNKNRRYTPDFLYLSNSSHNIITVVIEIKYQKDLKDNFDIHRIKFEAARIFCEEQGYEFKILTEKDIRDNCLQNCKFLHSYRNHKVDFESPLIRLILNEISQKSHVTPREIVESLSNDHNKKLEVIYYIWYLISIYKIKCFWNKPINMNSKIWV